MSIDKINTQLMLITLKCQTHSDREAHIHLQKEKKTFVIVDVWQVMIYK